MIKTLHGVSTLYCNVLTEVRLAYEAGYEAIEFLHEKLLRYLDHGGTTFELKKLLDQYGLKTGCLNALMNIERHGEHFQEMMREAERLTIIASELDCPTIQILALHGLDQKPYEEMMSIMSENIAEIADLGNRHGIRYQIEFIAYTKFNTLAHSLEVIRRINRANVGIVVDFWHLHASGAKPEDLLKIDPKLIFGVHFCDGRKPVAGETWNESVLRAYMPGEGEIDVQAWTDAVKKTGFNGVWSAELVSPRCWEYDHLEIARLCLENMISFTG